MRQKGSVVMRAYVMPSTYSSQLFMNTFSRCLVVECLMHPLWSLTKNVVQDPSFLPRLTGRSRRSCRRWRSQILHGHYVCQFAALPFLLRHVQRCNGGCSFDSAKALKAGRPLPWSTRNARSHQLCPSCHSAPLHSTSLGIALATARALTALPASILGHSGFRGREICSCSML